MVNLTKRTQSGTATGDTSGARPENFAGNLAPGSRLAGQIDVVRQAPSGARIAGNLTDAIRAIADPVGGIELDLPDRWRERDIPRFY